MGEDLAGVIDDSYLAAGADTGVDADDAQLAGGGGLYKYTLTYSRTLIKLDIYA